MLVLMRKTKIRDPNRNKPGLKEHFLARRSVRIGIISATLLIAGSIVAFFVFYKPPTFKSTPIQAAQEPIIYYSPLTGAEVDNEALTRRPVTAIMIENSPEARPQSGLKEAGVVFEAVAEGGITRFIALYQEAQPALVGPVRSLRPYYVEWAAGFDPAVVHVGGSARALDMIRGGGYGADLDQFFDHSETTFWRASDRWAPHNVYTSFEKLNALEQSKDKAASNFTPWPRQDGAAVEIPDATHINMPVSTGAFAVSYNYDVETNSYNRYQGGQPHMDREQGQIAPTVAIAIMVPMTYAMEDGYREQITTVGNGECFVFQNGTATQGTWRKVDAKSQIEFLDGENQPIELGRGQTWITAVPLGKEVSWQ